MPLTETLLGGAVGGFGGGKSMGIIGWLLALAAFIIAIGAAFNGKMDVITAVCIVLVSVAVITASYFPFVRRP